MTTPAKTLRQILAAGRTIWTAGAYDALSARLIDQAGFDAVFTTGFGISASHLGQPDVELYTMSENLGVVRNMVSTVRRPVIADGDTGYGNVINVMRTVREFERAGVAGIVFEDQVIPKRCPCAASTIEVLPREDAEHFVTESLADHFDAGKVERGVGEIRQALDNTARFRSRNQSRSQTAQLDRGARPREAERFRVGVGSEDVFQAWRVTTHDGQRHQCSLTDGTRTNRAVGDAVVHDPGDCLALETESRHGL